MRSERLAGIGATRGRAAAAQQQGALYVCPLSRVHETLVRTGARRLVTLINQQTMLETPPGIAPSHHLRIAVNDISEPQEGLVHPNEAHVEEIIRFADAWGRQGHLVVHCWAGISRSTAAAFITLCALNPETPERLVAERLRKASVTATPNRLLVRLADDLLGRRGRMVSAVEAIGLGEPANEALPFSLPAKFD
jgi:predicted protein tyrosine phosphatase